MPFTSRQVLEKAFIFKVWVQKEKLTNAIYE